MARVSGSDTLPSSSVIYIPNNETRFDPAVTRLEDAVDQLAEVGVLMAAPARTTATVITTAAPAAPITYLTLDDGAGNPIALGPGRYCLAWALAVAVSNVSAEAWVDVRRNGANSPEGGKRVKPGTTGGPEFRSGTDLFDLASASTYVATIVGAKASGPGSVTFSFGLLTLTRTGPA